MINSDYWYKKWINSTGATACIVRVTNQCNQRCRHCCLRSGPECIGQMSLKMCEQINAWVPKRVVLNIMGGEFTVLNNYQKMLKLLAKGRSHIRLVSNGFWSTTPFSTGQFLSTLEDLVQICKRVDVSTGTDQWHQISTPKAYELLEDNEDIGIKIVSERELYLEDIVPVGRAWDNRIVQEPQNHTSCTKMSNVTITEDGMISKCPYGYFPWKRFNETTWHDAQKYVWDWRSEKLSEGMNCDKCMETVEISRRKDNLVSVGI